MAFEWTNVINEIDQIEEKNSLALAKTTTTTTTTTPLVLRWLRHCLLHEVFPIESEKKISATGYVTSLRIRKSFVTTSVYINHDFSI